MLEQDSGRLMDNGIRVEMTTYGHEHPVVELPNSSHIMPLALFECLQGLTEYLVLDAD